MANLIAFIDGSAYSDSVLDHAAWAAGRLAASVDVVHVIGRRDVSSTPANLSGNLEMGAHQALLEELAAHDRERAILAQKRGRLIVDGGAERLREAGVATVQVKLRTGDVVEAVHDLEPDADLIVIGKRGEAADFAKLHLGSNLERVVRVTRRPVLVASRAFRPIARVLIAYDGGASAQKAIEHIASARLFKGLACMLVTVGQETHEARGRIEAAASTLRRAGLQTETLIEDGRPEEVIARHAEAGHVDLLVMGAYGHSRVRSFLIGSTTTEMVRSVKRPVMLFR